MEQDNDDNKNQNNSIRGKKWNELTSNQQAALIAFKNVQERKAKQKAKLEAQEKQEEKKTAEEFEKVWNVMTESEKEAIRAYKKSQRKPIEDDRPISQKSWFELTEEEKGAKLALRDAFARLKEQENPYHPYLNKTHKESVERKLKKIAEWRKSPLDLETALREQREREKPIEEKPDWVTADQWNLMPSVSWWEKSREKEQYLAQLPKVTKEEALEQISRLRNEKNWNQGA